MVVGAMEVELHVHASRSLKEKRSVVDVVLEEGILTKEQVAELLKPERMTQPTRATVD